MNLLNIYMKRLKYRQVFTEDQLKDIIDQYNNGKTASHISLQYKCGSYTIEHILKKNGVKINGNFIPCSICGKIVRNIYYHSKKFHQLCKKEYFDLYIKTENDGKCKECGKNTAWHKQYNYWQFCSKKCAAQYKGKNRELIEKQIKSREITCLKKYGTKHPFQSIEFQKMCKRRMVEKYGVINPSSVPEFVLKRIRSFVKSKPFNLPSGTIIYLAGYEPQFLKYIFNNKFLDEKEIVYNPEPIKYKLVHEDFERNYYPDFYIPKLNLIVEIKSDFVRDKLDTYFEEKKSTTINHGFNYLCVVNNNFDEFVKYLKENL